MTTRIAHPLCDDHLRAIGLVAVQASYLENLVSYAVWQMLELDEARGRIVTTHMLMRAKLDMLGAAADARLSDKDAKRLSEIIARIKEVMNARNATLHRVYLEDSLDYFPYTIEFDARGKMTQKIRSGITPDEILREATETEEVCLVFLQFMVDSKHFDVALP